MIEELFYNYYYFMLNYQAIEKYKNLVKEK